MVVEIISHIMPSIEDSLNVTLGCELALDVITDYEPTRQLYANVWRNRAFKSAFFQTHSLILPVVNLFWVIPLCYNVRVKVKYNKSVRHNFV
jgi:hypothetical protein